MRLAHWLGRSKRDEPNCTCDEVYDRACCRDATTGERTYRFLTAVEVHRREHNRFPTQGQACSAMANGLVQDVRRGVSDERNRSDCEEVWQRTARFFGRHADMMRGCLAPVQPGAPYLITSFWDRVEEYFRGLINATVNGKRTDARAGDRAMTRVLRSYLRL